MSSPISTTRGLNFAADFADETAMETGSRWHPTPYEIREILDELKPLIAELAHRDKVTLLREVVRTGPGIA